MIVRAKEDLDKHLTKDKEYESLRETDESYYVKNDEGVVSEYFKRRFEEIKESIFKKGDRVYNHNCGWLTISEESGYFCHCLDENRNLVIVQPVNLSFTEYAITGFSQERPLELPEVGELCLFSDDECIWYISEFNAKGTFNNILYTKDSGSFKYCKRVKFL